MVPALSSLQPQGEPARPAVPTPSFPKMFLKPLHNAGISFRRNQPKPNKAPLQIEGEDGQLEENTAEKLFNAM